MTSRDVGLGLLMLGLLASIASASASGDLEKAAQHRRVAFILVLDPSASGVDQAKELIRSARNQVKNSEAVELDRADPENAELVAKFRLAGAPVPLILVAAANGVLSGGVQASQTTVEKLVAMVPSPKKAEVLQALQSGKAVFLSLSRKGMAAQPGAMSACAMACGQMQDRSATVQIDLDDPAEAGFLSQMKIDLASREPITLVINPQGQITGSYTGATDVASLVQAASRKGGGCAPGACGPGASKSCGPVK